MNKAKIGKSKSANLVSKLKNLWAKINPAQLKDFKNFPKKQKIIVGGIIALFLILAVPFTRYPVLGLVIKKNLSIQIVDAKTGAPVTEAEIKVQGKTQKTDNEGKARIGGIKVGDAKVTITKKYYETTTFNAFVGLFSSKTTQFKATALGQLIKVKVINKISGQPVPNSVIKIGEESFRTDEAGDSQVIIASDATEAEAELSAEGYNAQKTKVVPSESQDASKENTFGITPVGKIYFLSKRTGKINVMKSDLDGSNTSVVLEGTGKEDDYEINLFPSSDGKYVALHARRGGDRPALYLIDTTNNDKFSNIDEGKVSFTIHRWVSEFLVYRVDRERAYSEDGRTAIKSFNAKTGQLKTLDENRGGHESGTYFTQNINNVYVFDNEIVYTKDWTGHGYNFKLEGKMDGLYGIKSDGQGKRAIKEYDSASVGYLDAILYKPNRLYVRTQGGIAQEFYEYEDGRLKSTNINNEVFEKSYSFYIASPSGKENIWSEIRDGKVTILLGDKEGENGRIIFSQLEFGLFGWYSDEYILLQKNFRELYIIGRNGGEALKVTDYHRGNYYH